MSVLEPPPAPHDPAANDVSAALGGVKGWYHCIEVAPGVVTPGLFDLRPIVDRLPWPDVRGKRCLDIGTWDGFFAFELERRGAREVVATDLPDLTRWDWEPAHRQAGLDYLHHVFGEDPSAGFRTARRLLGSQVQLEHAAVYELSPERLGTFDVVVCGSLLLHLRDPLQALEAIRSVCGGSLLCTNQIELRRSLLHPREPLFRLDGTRGVTQWWLPNVAGQRQLLRAGGFTIERETPLYAIPFGPAHPSVPRDVRALARRLLAGGHGVPNHAALARPAEPPR